LQNSMKLLAGKPESNAACLLPTLHGVRTIVAYKGSSPAIRKIDVAFPMLHGPMGEDGTIQGLLELAGMPYVGCGVMASSVGMDKEISKRLAVMAGVPVLEHVVIRREHADKEGKWLKDSVKLGFPLFVKPVRLGSSVGVSRASNERELKIAVKNAFRYDTKVMIEKGINRAREIVCAVLGDETRVEASVCGEVCPKGRHEFFDYDAKYVDPEGFDLNIPAGMSDEESKRIREAAVKVFKALEGYGMARVDFLLGPGGKKFYFCEINTIPGFTSHSLYPRLWEYSGLPMRELLSRLIFLALERSNHRRRLLLVPKQKGKSEGKKVRR
ncbi:MAG: D-alanine--D-alanine ligase family protein, partial [bacterium]